jgi:hypothetical protein
MENLIIFLASSFVLRLSAPGSLRNKEIGNTGCSALFFPDQDINCGHTGCADQLYVSRLSRKEVSYGMICIHLHEAHDLATATDMLAAYLNKLQEHFSILHSTGLHQAVDWNTASSKAVVDYWQDRDQKDWKVKGYTNGKTIAVLYVKNIGQADIKSQDLFLDGFHFGERTLPVSA